MYDVAIIGGGPAGTTLARRLGSKLKVLLIDRRNLGECEQGHGYTKCCGGLLAPDAQEMLAKQGLALPQDVLVGPQLFVVRTIDLEAGLEQYYQRFYINLDRERFDRWLFSLIPHSVEVRTNCLFRRFEAVKGVYRLFLVQNGSEYVEEAKILIGADGGNSRVRQQAFGQNNALRYISIQEWYESEPVSPYFSAIFDQEITDFYCWTIPKNDSVLLGAALAPGADATAKFALLKDKLQNYGYSFGRRIKREGAFILRPVKMNQIVTGDNQIALVGEAAGWISPSSAEGLSYAFRSSELLAESILEEGENFTDSYKKRTIPLKRNILLKNLKSPFMYKPLLRRLALKSGLKSIEVKP